MTISPRETSKIASIGLRLVHPQHREECLLRDLDGPDPLHPLLTLFLLFEQLALAGDVATVTLGQDVLAHRADGFARDDVAPDGRLDRHLEHLARDQLLQALASARPVAWARSRWTMMLRASTGSPFTRMSTLARSASR